MKKRFLAGIIATVSVLAMALGGCGKSGADDKIIKIGASPTPHAEILEVVKEVLAKDGYTLEIVEYDDYVLPNTALENGELDANYFQHKPYLDTFNEENGTHLTSVAFVHFEPFGIYSAKVTSLEELTDGASVSVPNDPTNEARALLLLEAQGLIKLSDDAGITATVNDIVENPLNLTINELEAAQVARTVQDVDIVALNGNYALEAGYEVKNAIAVEAADSLAAETYANIIAVKEGNENTDKIKALVNAILSDEVKEYIEKEYEGSVVPVF